MLRMLVLTVLLSGFAGGAWSGTRRAETFDETPPGGVVLPSFLSVWGGGPSSLPYNGGVPWSAIASHASTLAGVGEVMDEFSSRGYIRRADKDTAITGEGR